jgi:hypothetical protein
LSDTDELPASFMPPSATFFDATDAWTTVVWLAI